MASDFQKFKDLHHSADLLILPNAWNAASAKSLQQLNYPAIATSSAAVAKGLGYDDGEQIPFDEYLFIIRRIIASVSVPLTVDIETGYGNTTTEIYNNIKELAQKGVVGINIEDSIIDQAGRLLRDASEFATQIETIKRNLIADNIELFINIRIDTYILNVENKKGETRKRLKIYEATGADGIFLPCISSQADIADAIAHTSLPLNVMCYPDLPDFGTLKKLGVKRVSFGPFLFNKVYEEIGKLTQVITSNQNISPLL